MCLAVARSEVRGGHVLSRYFQLEKQLDASQHVFAPKRKCPANSRCLSKKEIDSCVCAFEWFFYLSKEHLWSKAGCFIQIKIKNEYFHHSAFSTNIPALMNNILYLTHLASNLQSVKAVRAHTHPDTHFLLCFNFSYKDLIANRKRVSK